MLHTLRQKALRQLRSVLALLVFPAIIFPTFAQRGLTMRPEITGRVGIVAAGRHYSVSAGVRILAQGGNAFDAGAATVFAASVTEISHFGFGGESPVVIYDAKRKEVVVVNGQGSAPMAATVDMFKAKGEVDANGPRAATIPAVLDAICLVLTHYGTMSLSQVMEPAIELADGFPMYGFLQHYLVSERKACEPYDWTMKTYYPEGRTTQTGEMFRQPNLARTLREIVSAEKRSYARTHNRVAAIQAARDYFYKGALGRRIAQATQAAGGLITADDLAGYTGKIEKPVTTNFHGFDVYKCGPWDQGPVLLQTLNILEGFDLAGMGFGSTQYIHTVTEAIKLAYDDRDTYYGDPDFAKIPIRGLLSKDYAAEQRKLIDPATACLTHRPGDPWKYEGSPTSSLALPYPRHVSMDSFSLPPESGDTTCVNVVDKDGNLFSCTPSSGWLLGGAFVAGDTGVPMSNRMQAFSLDPKSPNVLQGGKRPRTTLTPTIVMKDGKPFLAISTPGGDSQDQQILNVLLNVMVFGMGIQEAIEAPRINSNHMASTFGNHADRPGALELEDRILPAVIEALRTKGHVITVREAFGMSTGVTAVGVDPAGTLRGGADVRRERYVFGW